jgi:dihydroflavonol-4-reductase
MIGPAVAGVVNVMKAASKHKIKRVVITSSIAAILD